MTTLGKHWKHTYKRKVKPFSREHIENMRLAHQGKRIGKENPMWKGEDTKYRTIHQWVCRWKGQSDTCENCGKDNLTAQQIQWANIDHKYRRVLEDYIRLCAKCHLDYDKEYGNR